MKYNSGVCMKDMIDDMINYMRNDMKNDMIDDMINYMRNDMKNDMICTKR